MTRRIRFALPGLLLSVLAQLGAGETIHAAGGAPQVQTSNPPDPAASAPAAPAPPAASPAPPTHARPVTPDPVDCIGRARAVLAPRDPMKDDEARAAAYGSLRNCLRALVDGGENMNALSVARAGHEMLPAEPRAGFDYGALLMLTNGDPAESRAVLEAALAQTPRLAPTTTAERALAVGNLGKLALARGDAAAARELLGKAMALDPDHVDFLYDIAAADKKAGDADACLQHLQAALDRDPAGAARDDYLLGSWALVRQDRYADAASLLRKGIVRLPNAAGLHLNLGYALARDGRPVEALLEYRYELANGASGDPYALEAQRQFQDALGRAQATPQHTVAIQHLRGAVVEDSRDPAKILAHLDALGRAGFHHPTLDLLRAEALYAAKDTEGSERALRALITGDPAFLPPYFDLSVILRDAGKDDEARRLVAEAVKRNPNHWQLAAGPPDVSK